MNSASASSFIAIALPPGASLGVALSFGHLNRRRLAHWLRALRALATASTHGYTGAPDLPRQRFVRAADRAASATTLPSTLVASLTDRRAAHAFDTVLLARFRSPRCASYRQANCCIGYRGTSRSSTIGSLSCTLGPNTTVNRTRRHTA